MYGINGRPVFTQEQIDKELKQVVLLDRILAENGALTFRQLNDVVFKTDKRNNFKTSNDLVQFIGTRTNIFEVSFDLVRNHSQEFREMFGYLVNFLCVLDQSKCNLETVFHVIMRCSPIVVSKVGNTEKKVRYFLEKHKNFFIMCESNGVMLSRICREIPSAWERRALPTYKNAIRRRAFRYDRSIVLDGIGKVVSAVSNTGYIKIEIVRGPWKAQTVFGLSKNVSNEVNLAKKYPIGTLVKILAYRAYEAAHPWTATKVTSADDHDNIWCVEETGTMDRLLEKYQCVLKDRSLTEVGRAKNTMNTNSEIAEKKLFNSSPDRTFKTKSVGGSASPRFIMKSVSGETEKAGAFRRNSVERRNSIVTEAGMEMNSNYWKFYNDVILDEMKKSQEVDECLRDGPKTFRQIFNMFIEGDTFAYYSYMVDFIIVRSHLYEIDEDRVWMRNHLFRSEMLKFLRYIDEKSRENITVHTLRKLISANDGDFVEEMVSYAENADIFLKFIEKHASLIELAEACGEQFIFLRGTYISDWNIFLPKFHFPRSLSNH
uniref:Tudor domain-containing protein n=1 Tax=Loa loa TaxID=7209 RepID=A0A1I7VX07_LOALO